jgi:hypothetical protein
MLLAVTGSKTRPLIVTSEFNVTAYYALDIAYAKIHVELWYELFVARTTRFEIGVVGII